MPVPSAPTSFTATPTAYGILLTWAAQAGVDGFLLFRGVLAGHGDSAAYPISDYITAGSGTSYMDTAVTAGTHYYYRLEASSLADGESTNADADAIALPAGMSLTTARLWARDSARNADDVNYYDATRIDHAIFTVGQRFCRKTKCVRTAQSITLTADSAALDISGLTRFLPERLMSANLLTVACPLKLVNWSDLYRKQIDCETSGKPKEIAFESPTVAGLWPTPDDAYTLRMRFWQPFTTWTLGTGSPDNVRFNLPDEYMGELLTYGVSALVQHNEPQNAYASVSWKKYLEYELEMMGAGDLAARTYSRAMQE